MELDRRQIMALVPALAIGGGKASAQNLQDPDDPLQRSLANFWLLVQSLPNIVAPAHGTATDICYMFTNKSCTFCQVVHKSFPHGFRKLEMHYIICPWPGDDNRELNYLYRPGVTEADYRQYMSGRMTARAPSNSPVMPQQVLATAGIIARELIEGGAFGTPFFLATTPGSRPGTIVYLAGDLTTAGPMLDRDE